MKRIITLVTVLLMCGLTFGLTVIHKGPKSVIVEHDGVLYSFKSRTDLQAAIDEYKANKVIPEPVSPVMLESATNHQFIEEFKRRGLTKAQVLTYIDKNWGN